MTLIKYLMHSKAILSVDLYLILHFINLWDVLCFIYLSEQISVKICLIMRSILVSQSCSTKSKNKKCHLKMSWPFTDFSDPRSIFISTVDCICNTSLNSNLILLVRSKDYEYQLLVCF